MEVLTPTVLAGGGGGAGGGGTPGGSDTQVQYNSSGAFAGSADLTWDDTGKVLGVGGDVDLDDGGTYTTTLQTITATANRTISFPDATGTVALVAGSSGQLIYNSAGANAGTPTLTYDGSILTSTGQFINSYNATASSPAKAFTGTWFTGGTATTTKPQVLIEPTGTTSTAWSTSGTGLGVNAASGFAGNLLDLQVGGVSVFSVPTTGAVVNYVTASANTYFSIKGSSPARAAIGVGNGFGFTGCETNYPYRIRTNNTDRIELDTIGSVRIVTGLTVATLPGTPAVGMIARVTDADAPAVGSTVTGGGAAAALVWWNGSNWTVIGV